MTSSQPKNTSEWQLYHVLQRANLLQYYDTFISQGGDDVQQLCEAGEEEFLEIMALVGMASKPLHVRRLQKSLQEWVANPGAFQGQMQPMSMIGNSTSPNQLPQSVATMNQISGATAPVNQMKIEQTNPYQLPSTSPVMNARSWSPSPHMQPSVSPGPANSSACSTGNQSESKEEKEHSSSPLPTPVLVESQIQALEDSAANLAKDLPYFKPKSLNIKKQINREIMALIQQTGDNPTRLEDMRKFAKIYGRFDSKRKNIKPMSMHEISVNEAAAQLCLHMPSLLTRREDLFPLARQVVRDSGYQYSKGHSRAGETVLPSAKRPRWDPTFLRMLETYPGMYRPLDLIFERAQTMERMSTIIKDIASLKQTQEEFKKQIQAAQERGDVETAKTLQDQYDQNLNKLDKLLTEQTELKKMKKASRISMLGFEDDDTVSDLPSGGSSPCGDNSADGDEFPAQLRAQFDPSQLSQLTKSKLMNDTLFDEGLRIAEQYGMEGFAQELKGLKEPEIDGIEELGSLTSINKSNGHSTGDYTVLINPTNESSQNNHVISDSNALGTSNDIPVSEDS